MTSRRQLSLSAQPHNNQQLFSDHFLNTNLPRMKDWQMLAADPQVKAIKARIAGLLDRFTPSTMEAQTEDDLVKPVLEMLDHTFEVQAALRTPDGTKRPDYVFLKDEGTRAALKGKTLDDALLKSAAFAVGDAKYWDRPLDIAIRTGADPFNNKNPSYQIAFYMQHSGVAWGILTNGRLWRLYHKDTAHKLDRFYEVDLPALVASNDDEAFLYFYAFLSRPE